MGSGEGGDRELGSRVGDGEDVAWLEVEACVRGEPRDRWCSVPTMVKVGGKGVAVQGGWNVVVRWRGKLVCVVRCRCK